MSAVAHRLVDEVPTPAVHHDLSVAVGWGDAFWWDAMAASLAGSVCGVVAYDEADRPVAMGRVVGDGAFYFYVQDVVVHPDHQGRGLGRQVVERLLAQVSERAPGHCFVGLFATPQARALYESEGFTQDSMTGLWKVLRD